jgi:hypothetical protein
LPFTSDQRWVVEQHRKIPSEEITLIEEILNVTVGVLPVEFLEPQ